LFPVIIETIYGSTFSLSVAHPSFWVTPGSKNMIHKSPGQKKNRKVEYILPLKLSYVGHSLCQPDSPRKSPELTSYPCEYYDLQTVISKDKALSLPPHRPYEHAI